MIACMLHVIEVIVHLIVFMSFTTKSPRSGSCITTAWLIGLGCLLDGLRVFHVNTFSYWFYKWFYNCFCYNLGLCLALDLVLCLGPITSGGVVSLVQSSKYVSIHISSGCPDRVFFIITIFIMCDRYDDVIGIFLDYLTCLGFL